MAGGRVHECGPFEARQVHEERQGPDIRGTEGACPAPLPLCGHMHVGNRISTGRSHTSGESCIPGASHMHLIIWGLDLDLGPWHSTQHSILDTALGTALGAQHGADTANPLSTTLYTAPRLPCPVSRLRTFNRIVRRSKRGGAGLFCVALSLQPATFATTAEQRAAMPTVHWSLSEGITALDGVASSSRQSLATIPSRRLHHLCS